MLVPVSDGRTLAVTEGGDPNGTPVFYLHGTPLSGRFYPPHLQAALERGLRLIGYDRPGYGSSDPLPGRRVVDAAADVAAIADALQISHFAVSGWSGGGPHALACAAVLTDRVTCVATASSIAPYGVTGLNWLQGMGEGNIAELRSALAGRDPLSRFVEKQLRLAMSPSPEISPELRSMLSPVDRQVLSGALGPYLESGTKEGTALGPAGWVDDDLAFVAPWGFELSAIRAPVSIWHGKQDLFVPFAHGIWLASKAPESEFRSFDGEGHLSLYERRTPEVFDWLLANGRNPGYDLD